MSRKRSKRNKNSFLVFIVAGALTFLLNILGLDIPVNDTSKHEVGKFDTETMKVHFLDVDQGLAILVQLGDEVLVYDGGERDTSSFVVAYLKDQRVREIDYLISSHYDSDHVSGLIGCLNTFDVKMVIGSDYVHDSNLYTSFMDAVDAEGLKMQYPEVGTQYRMEDAVITILSPEEITGDSNSNSVAIMLSYGEMDFIFTGDADYKSEREMIETFGYDLDCEVLSVGHHGSATATSEDFLYETTPDYAVISCGKDNSYGHPHKETLQFLQEYEVEVLRNDESGTIVAETDGVEILWTTEK